MQLQRSRNSLASRFFTLSPKNGLKGNNNKNVRKKLLLLFQTIFDSTCEIADFQFRFLIEIHFDIFIYSQFLIY